MKNTTFELEVRRLEGTGRCEFRLAQSNQSPLLVEVIYPPDLEQVYEQWQTAYLDHYLQRRAEVLQGGSINQPRDRRTPLILSEDKLRRHFQEWLRHPDLHNLRAEIVKATKSLDAESGTVDVFLTCWSDEIARLPWETWEVGPDPEVAARVRLTRSPINIKQKSVKPIGRQARVLVILATAPELDLSQDLDAIQNQLPKTVKVTVFQAEPGKPAAELSLKIQALLQDPRGWDMLFFAGHSDESDAGGQLGLAPQVLIQMKELHSSLEVARQNGLQFAFFNSCNGLKMADALIQAGIGQVVVMREPLPDAAAPIFLREFLEKLAQYQDVHSALQSACTSFSKGKRQTQYPSLSLVPSLFRHPTSQIFRIQPYGLKHKLQRWLPTRSEQRWLVFLLLISLLPGVQDLLLEPRILLQAVYQQTTGQVPASELPPVLLVEIDNRSLQKTDKDLINGRYLNYSYLADLINQLSARDAKVIGIDYILDQDKAQGEEAKALKAAIERAKARGTQFVFGRYKEKRTRFGISNDLVNIQDHQEGDLDMTEWVVQLPTDPTCEKICPFAYQMAHSFAPEDKTLEQLKLNYLSQKSHTLLQNWFEPIIDFSLPEQAAYARVSSCSIVGDCPDELSNASLKNQMLLIAHGGYKQGGLYREGDDNYAQPLARSYLATQKKAEGGEEFLGGEAHAYSVHHLLKQHLVIPLPDVLVLLLAAALGKGISLFLVEHPGKRRQLILISQGVMIVYIFSSLQIYFSAFILIPFGLPIIAYWIFFRNEIKREYYV